MIKVNYTKTMSSCLLCKTEILATQLSNHCGSKQCNAGRKFKYTKDYKRRISLECKFCNMICKSTNAATQHEIRCKSNPDKINSAAARIHRELDPTPCNHCNKIFTNKSGLKNHEIRCPKNPEQKLQFASTENMKIGKAKSKIKTKLYWEKEENVLAARTRMQNAVLNNPESYTSSNRGRTKQIVYNDIKFQGQWELDFYIWCELNSIDVCRSPDWFDYEFNGKRKYNPDFYIASIDLYVEVKGYEIDRDRAKWDALVNVHNKKLLVVDMRSIQHIKKNAITMEYMLSHFMHT